MKKSLRLHTVSLATSVVILGCGREQAPAESQASVPGASASTVEGVPVKPRHPYVLRCHPGNPKPFCWKVLDLLAPTPERTVDPNVEARSTTLSSTLRLAMEGVQVMSREECRGATLWERLAAVPAAKGLLPQDGWGREYRVTCGPKFLVVASSGEDGIWGSRDDIAGKVDWSNGR